MTSARRLCGDSGRAGYDPSAGDTFGQYSVLSPQTRFGWTLSLSSRRASYDFDTNGMLQVVTYVWAGSPGAASMFAERIKSLSSFYTLPPAKGGRVELDVPLGRLVLQEVAAQNQALESYSARK